MSPKGAWHNAGLAQGLLGQFEAWAGRMGDTGVSPSCTEAARGDVACAEPGGNRAPRGAAGQWGGHRDAGAMKAKRVGGGTAPCPAVQMGSELLRSSARGGRGAASWLQLMEECLFAEQPVIFPALYLFAAT